MDKQGLMPHNGFPFSRDFGLDFSCDATRCPFHNQSIINGVCVTPSAVTLDSTGKCKLFEAFLKDEQENFKNKKLKE